MKKILILLILSIFAVFPALSDVIVKDAETGNPLPSASVKVKCLGKDCPEKEYYARTDKDGKIFPLKGNLLELKISYIGYEPVVDTVNTRDVREILLKPVSIITDEVVTTGQFIPQSAQKSVFTVNVISNEVIKDQSATDLRELMLKQMNININQDNILGSSMMINGITGQNVKILVDGVPMIGRLNGNIDISQVNLNDVDRIEIVEGPMSSVYGTDALAGVVNIISKTPDKKTSLNINSYYESVGKANFDGKVSFPVGDVNVSLNGGRNFFGGYSIVDTSRWRQWKPKIQYFAGLQASTSFDDINIRYSGSWFNEFILNRGQRLGPYYENAWDDKYYTNRINNSLFLNTRVGDHKYISLTTNYSFYQREKETYFKDLVNLTETLKDDSTSSNIDKFDLFMIRATYSSDRPVEYLSWQTGVDVNVETARGKRINGDTRDIGDYAMFLGLQYEPFGNLLIQPTLRAIHNTRYDAPIVPTLNIKFTPADKFNIRGTYARGFRAPSLKEKFYDFVDDNHEIIGNPDLRAERSHSVHVDFDYRIESDDYAIKFEPKLFYNFIEDHITLVRKDTIGLSYLNRNIGEFSSLGANLAATYFTRDLMFKLGFVYTGTNYNLDEASSGEFNYSPELHSNFSYLYDPWDIKLSAVYKFVSSHRELRISVTSDIIEYDLDDYHILDFTLSKPLFDNIFVLNAGVKNLFDVKNVGDSGSGGHAGGGELPISYGRTMFVSLAINFDEL